MQPNNGYSDPYAVSRLISAIEKENCPSKQYRIMEVCGTHTMSIARHGINGLIPPNISLVSGPGCPVCVTSQADIDNAIELAYKDNTFITTFGDMLRVTGTDGRSLYNAKAEMHNVSIIYSPLDTISAAEKNPDKLYIFLAVGFETTAPMAAGLIKTANSRHMDNICIYSMCKTMPAAFDLLLSDPRAHIDGFLCPGNVSIITGTSIYEPIVQAGKAAVISGFEPADILSSILEIVKQINKDEFSVLNNYLRAVKKEGNIKAKELTNEIFMSTDARWRGLGLLDNSGLAVRQEYKKYDAVDRLSIDANRPELKTACRCGDVLMGHITPKECAMFGSACTPEKAVGPCMVSSEGACAASYKYRSRG